MNKVAGRFVGFRLFVAFVVAVLMVLASAGVAYADPSDAQYGPRDGGNRVGGGGGGGGGNGPPPGNVGNGPPPGNGGNGQPLGGNFALQIGETGGGDVTIQMGEDLTPLQPITFMQSTFTLPPVTITLPPVIQNLGEFVGVPTGDSGSPAAVNSPLGGE